MSTCEKCKFSKLDSAESLGQRSKVLECRRYPPQWVALTQVTKDGELTQQARPQFPRVNGSLWWCGEFVPALIQ